MIGKLSPILIEEVVAVATQVIDPCKLHEPSLRRAVARRREA